MGGEQALDRPAVGRVHVIEPQALEVSVERGRLPPDAGDAGALLGHSSGERLVAHSGDDRLEIEHTDQLHPATRARVQADRAASLQLGKTIASTKRSAS